MGRMPKSTFSVPFRWFHKSANRTMQIIYDSIEDATKAQKAMLGLMNREKIFNVSICRRRNVISLEKDRIKHEAEYESFRSQIMDRFLRRD